MKILIQAKNLSKQNQISANCNKECFCKNQKA